MDLNEEIPYQIEYIAELLPEDARRSLLDHEELADLIEVFLDLGRVPVARFQSGDFNLSDAAVEKDVLRDAENKVGAFNKDNRAGISKTLHRISCMRNRIGNVVGITCRVGRDIPNCASHINDIVKAGKSLLILGPPGVGKTTTIRCLCKYIADEVKKRVVIVDTSNEIAGDGDVPHDSVGSARRMQLPDDSSQHKIMIEAVQNHTPEVLVIDEIGRAEECEAARIVSWRGVQLIASAHGRRLKDLLHDPIIRELLGGTQTVIRSDATAAAKNLPKVSLERKSDPSFDVLIEMKSREEWRVIDRLREAVDLTLRNKEVYPQVRYAGGGNPASAPQAWNITETLALAGDDWAVDTTEQCGDNWQPLDQSILELQKMAVASTGIQDDVTLPSLSEIQPPENNPAGTSIGVKSGKVDGRLSKPVEISRKGATHKIPFLVGVKSGKVDGRLSRPVEISRKGATHKADQVSSIDKIVKRILLADSHENVLLVYEDTDLETINKTHKQLLEKIKQVATEEGRKARLKVEEAYEYFRQLSVDNAKADIEAIMSSKTNYDCLQVEKNVTKAELGEVYKEWCQEFPYWEGLKRKAKAQKKLAKAYAALSSKIK